MMKEELKLRMADREQELADKVRELEKKMACDKKKADEARMETIVKLEEVHER